MHIVYLVPAAMANGPMGAQEMRRRESLLQEWSFHGAKVTVSDVPGGVTSIESSYEELLAAAGSIAFAQADAYPGLVAGRVVMGVGAPPASLTSQTRTSG
mgnify:CR=1 FL=1